jgi:hypothetical protein
MTAVEYLEEKFDKYIAYNVEGCHKTEKFTYNDMLKAFAEALEIEKQQIMKAFTDGFANTDNGLQYYETFKKRNEMKEEILSIASDLREGSISLKEAKELLENDDLFGTPIKYSTKMKEWPIMKVIKNETK